MSLLLRYAHTSYFTATMSLDLGLKFSVTKTKYIILPVFPPPLVPQVCNLFGCKCDTCYDGCDGCQRLTRQDQGFGGALAPAATANTSATPADPCSGFDSFAALTVPQQMEQLKSAFCADPSTSTGFKFLGYVLNLVDTNKDGVISCAEYNADQASNLNVITKKPGCRLAAGMKLKNAHSKA